MKKRFYDCANHQYEYDDFGKYHWCLAHVFGGNECICNRIWSMQYCPCYEKGLLKGTFEVTIADKKHAEEFKHDVIARKNAIECSERAEYERLKKKFG